MRVWTSFLISLLTVVTFYISLTAGQSFQPKACDFGISPCPPHEQCQTNSRKRDGKCECITGYLRDTAGICIASTNETLFGGEHLLVSIKAPTVVQLPANCVHLIAQIVKTDDVFRNATNDVEVYYRWFIERLSDEKQDDQLPEISNAQRSATTLCSLRPGKYKIKVVVTMEHGNSIDGPLVNDTSADLLVLKEKKRPVAIVQPPVYETKEKTQIILDGSKSIDTDGKIVTYSWTQVDGPKINSSLGDFSHTPTLTIPSLNAGYYTFNLTVTDNDGLAGSALAKVSVVTETDYPPKAVAGACDGKLGDVAVTLPIQALYLCGNASTDDKKITKWKWTMKENAADVEGTGSPVLKVWNLQPGDYTFRLSVEDEKGHSSDADVHVIVFSAKNEPPVAHAGGNMTIRYPESSVILDGSLSADDHQIVSYHWNQLDGPSAASLANADNARMTASKLQAGTYTFELNVTDAAGLSSADTVSVTVEIGNNHPPVPVAQNVTVSLPCNLVMLNGSGSTDDAGIVGWLWTLHDDSPVGLTVLGNSSRQPLLYVSSLSVGVYVFNFTVSDKQGASGSKLVALTVTESEMHKESVIVVFNVKFSESTYRLQKKLMKQLQALLESEPKWDRVDMTVINIAEDSTDGSLRISFYAAATTSGASSPRIIKSSVIVQYLQLHAYDSSLMADISIKSVEGLYCESDCSGRGRCDSFTKRCTCNRYWMPNLLAWYSRGTPKDCDWSVLYFVLALLLSVIILIVSTWLLIRNRRLCWSTIHRTRRYRMLSNGSVKHPTFNLKSLRARNGRAARITSDSDPSSEEESLYDRSVLLKK